MQIQQRVPAEIADMINQRLLDLRSRRGSAVPRKSNRYGSLKIWVARSDSGRRQRGGEIRERFALTRMDAGLDLEREYVVRPPLFNDLANIPQSLGLVVEFL